MPLNKNEIINTPESIRDFPIKFSMNMNDFGVWFVKYKSLHPFPVLTKFQKFKRLFKDVPIPNYFVNKFVVIRTYLYDVLYSLNEFDISRPPWFKCKICKERIFTSFDDLFKHERECKEKYKCNKHNRNKIRNKKKKM